MKNQQHRGPGDHDDRRDRPGETDRGGMGQSGYGAGFGDRRWQQLQDELQRSRGGEGRWEGESTIDSDRPYDQPQHYASGLHGQPPYEQTQYGQPPGPHRGKGPKNWQRSNERLHDAIGEALSDDEHVDASHIEIAVHDGEVTLTGTVEDRRMKRLAEMCVERIAGVEDVHNQLRLRSLERGSHS